MVRDEVLLVEEFGVPLLVCFGWDGGRWGLVAEIDGLEGLLGEEGGGVVGGEMVKGGVSSSHWKTLFFLLFLFGDFKESIIHYLLCIIQGINGKDY